MQYISVVFGGKSNENEISAVTGTMAANILKKGGENIVALYISPDGEFYTGDKLLDIRSFSDGGYKTCPKAAIARGGICVLSKRGKCKKFLPVSAALNCCHGGLGEGGGLEGLFAFNGIPLAGAGIFPSAAFIDKYLTKIVLKGLGVRTPPYVYVREDGDISAAFRLLPAVLKPARLGSSIGVTVCRTRDELREAFAAAVVYDSAVIVEKYLSPRREINCAAYRAGDVIYVSECEEAKSSGELLSFEDKYAGGGRSVFPAEIPADISDKIKKITRDVYGRLNTRGVVRFDYILSGGDIYLLEVNTVPGSLAWYLFSRDYKSFAPVLKAVIADERARFEKEGKKRVLHTGILNNIPQNACKRGAK